MSESLVGQTLERLQLAQVLHFRGRVVADDDELMLVLADNSALAARTLRDVKLAQTRLAVLASTWADRSADDAPQHAVRLARNFLAAGVGAVVVSLWPVPQAPGRLFTDALYAALAQGSSPAQAVAAGTAAVRDRRVDGTAPYEHPVHWGGFTLFGHR